MDSEAGSSMLDPVEPLAEEYLRRRRRGERPTAAEYAARYPELASRVLELFPALDLMEGLKPTPEEVADLSEGGGFATQCENDHLGKLGEYTLIRELGRGGMGIVYEAEHESLKSRVALKVIHPRFRGDKAYVRRFQTEARSAAKLHHTNIVPVFDYGQQDGVFYYAMQCIAGLGLDHVLRDVRRLKAMSVADEEVVTNADFGNAGRSPSAISRGLVTGDFAGLATMVVTIPNAPLSAEARAEHSSNGDSSDAPPATSFFASQPDLVYFREVARIGSQIAEALDYAHKQKVIHRDIKPQNLLLDTRGNVWVTDFGLAKLMEADDLSQSHDLVGTLRFMAPERFRGITHPLGDVYSLGATLYELLTLKPAFDERDQARLTERIVNDAPRPLREYDGRIPRDLETLVLKALAKDPKDRFATAAELGEELRLYLQSRPIKSRPVGSAERAWRWCKRSPGTAAASLGAAILTLLLLIGSMAAALVFYHQRDQITRDNKRITEANRSVRETLFDSLTAQARALRLSGRVGQRFESLAALERATEIGRELRLSPDHFNTLRAEAIACLALPDITQTGRVIKRPANTLSFADDNTMTRYAIRLKDGTITVRRFADDGEVARFRGRGDRNVAVFGFSPDGRYLMTTHYPEFALTAWNIEQGTVAVEDAGPVRWACAGFSPDSRRIFLVHENGEVVVHALDGSGSRTLARFPNPRTLVVRPDGAQIALSNGGVTGPYCTIIAADAGHTIRSFPLPTRAADVLAWSDDGTTLAGACDDFKIYLWDALTGARKATLAGHSNGGINARFHPSGTLLASCGWDGQWQLWDPVQGRSVLKLPVSAPLAEFGSDWRTVLGIEDEFRTYVVDPALEYRTLANTSGTSPRIWDASMRHDGRVMALGTDRGVRLYDVTLGTELAVLPIGIEWHPVFDASGDLITLGEGLLGVHRWPVTLDRERGQFSIGPPRRLPLPAGAGLAVDRAGRTVAVANFSEAVAETPDGTATFGPLDDCRFVAVSPDGQWLATGSHGQNGVQVWRISDAACVARLEVEGLVHVTFSPDGRRLMTSPAPCRLWEVGAWNESKALSGEGLCFSPDGRSVVTQEASRVLRLFDTETGKLVTQFEPPDLSTVHSATFTPDGSQLIVVSTDGPAVHIWDLRSVRKQLAVRGLDWDAPAFAEADSPGERAKALPRLVVDLGPLASHAWNKAERREGGNTRDLVTGEADVLSGMEGHGRNLFSRMPQAPSASPGRCQSIRSASGLTSQAKQHEFIPISEIDDGG